MFMRYRTRSPASSLPLEMKRTHCLAVTACLLLTSPVAGGTHRTDTHQTKLAYQVKPGMWAFHDADTGKAPNGAVATEHLQAIRAELAELLNRSSEGLVVRELANGVKAMDLQGRFQNVTILNIGADGSRKLTCTESLEAAVEAMRPRTIPMVDGLETE